MIEECKSIKDQINVKPMVEFVDQAPQLLSKVKELESMDAPQFIEG